MKNTILIAGGTGNLGGKIINALLERGADVRMVVRAGSDAAKWATFEQRGVQVIPVDMSNLEELTKACAGVSCVVSALQGLHDVIVDAQAQLLAAAVAAGVAATSGCVFSCRGCSRGTSGVTVATVLFSCFSLCCLASSRSSFLRSGVSPIIIS